MSQPAGVVGRTTPAEAGAAAGGVHLTALYRAYGRIFSIVAVLPVLVFWVSAATQPGLRPASATANALLSLLLVRLAMSTLRRPLTQQDLNVLAVATGVLVLASRLLATPGSPFLEQAAYLPVNPIVIAWAALSRRLVALVPVLLTVLATGVWNPGSLVLQQLVTTLTTGAFAGFAARMLRSGAARADAEADRLSQQMAAQDAALAAEQAEQRAANAVHDDVLSVLRALIQADQMLPWGLLVAKAERAQLALSRQAPENELAVGALGPALQQQVIESATGLDVRCDIENGLEAPAGVAGVLSAAAGEALRNIVAHAGVPSARVEARRDGSGGVRVTVSDDGAGFDPANVGSSSRGLRHSIRARLRDVGGDAEVISAPGQGTTVILKWRPGQPDDAVPSDPLAWGRRLAPPTWLTFLGFMAPNLVSSLVLLVLRWQDLRWHAVGVAVFLGLLLLAGVCARCINRVQMAGTVAASMVIAVTALAALGSLAVAPGTTDAFAYWVSGETTIVIAVVYFLRGPVLGLTTLALDLAALVAGLLVTGHGISGGGWVGVLSSPVLACGLGVGFLAAFRGLSNYTERQLADYAERLRRQARAEAVSRADSAALANARRIAGPVLRLVTSGQPPSAGLREAAAIANATIRDELLAPGFLTAGLADRVRAARAAGAHVTVDIARQGDAALMDEARRLLTAAVARPDAVADVTLCVHPPKEGHPALLVLHLHGLAAQEPEALRGCARDYGAELSDLGDNEYLVLLQAPAQPARTAA